VLASLGIVIAAVLAGCNNEPQLRPPKPPERFAPPPDNDPRFSSAPEYPKNLLFTDELIKEKDTSAGPGGPGGMNAPGGGGPRMGAGGRY
jgi:hypothetical protein